MKIYEKEKQMKNQVKIVDQSLIYIFDSKHWKYYEYCEYCEYCNTILNCKYKGSHLGP